MLEGIAHLVAMASISSAQAQSVTLDLINEYPATAISGEADAFFADAVKRRSEGRIAVNLIPDAKSGLRSRDQLKAVSEGALRDGRLRRRDTRAAKARCFCCPRCRSSRRR